MGFGNISKHSDYVDTSTSHIIKKYSERKDPRRIQRKAAPRTHAGPHCSSNASLASSDTHTLAPQQRARRKRPILSSGQPFNYNNSPRPVPCACAAAAAAGRIVLGVYNNQGAWLAYLCCHLPEFSRAEPRRDIA